MYKTKYPAQIALYNTHKAKKGAGHSVPKHYESMQHDTGNYPTVRLVLWMMYNYANTIASTGWPWVGADWAGLPRVTWETG